MKRLRQNDRKEKHHELQSKKVTRTDTDKEEEELDDDDDPRGHRAGTSAGTASGDLEDEQGTKVSWQEVEEKAYDKAELKRLEEEEYEPFDLSEERNLGSFDESGSFIWKRRDLEDEGDEAWLTQVGNQVAAPRKKREAEGDSDGDKAPGNSATNLWLVISLLKLEETPLSALRRLRFEQTKFDKLTDACSSLLNNGIENVYALEREHLIAKLPPVTWEYQVSGLEDVHGPFDGRDMQQWREDGFFSGDSAEQCFVRIYGQQEWVEAKNVATFLLSPEVMKTSKTRDE